MKRTEAFRLKLPFYRDDSGELRRTSDDARWQRRRQPDANRIAARKAGDKHYVDEDGFRRQTQNGKLVAKGKLNPVPTERRGHCAYHGWVRFSIALNECKQCIAEQESCILHGPIPPIGYCTTCFDAAGNPHTTESNPLGFYINAEGNIVPAPEG